MSKFKLALSTGYKATAGRLLSLRATFLILCGYLSITMAAFIVHPVVGYLVLGLLLLVVERSLERGDTS